jgi:hypothetical protein
MGVLDQLEATLATLPTGATKHDMEPGFEVMARWIEDLDTDHRAETLASLPVWLRENHTWHSRAAMELALRLQIPGLLIAAISEARRRGIPDSTARYGYPPWLIYQLDLLSTISRWQGDPGEEALAYLRDLRIEAMRTQSYPRRLLGIRAWFTECLLGRPEQRRLCLAKGMGVLRGWDDSRLLRSGLSLLHAYFATSAEGVTDLRQVLTPAEFSSAYPTWSRAT